MAIPMMTWHTEGNNWLASDARGVCGVCQVNDDFLWIVETFDGQRAHGFTSGGTLDDAKRETELILEDMAR